MAFGGQTFFEAALGWFGQNQAHPWPSTLPSPPGELSVAYGACFVLQSCAFYLVTYQRPPSCIYFDCTLSHSTHRRSSI